MQQDRTGVEDLASQAQQVAAKIAQTSLEIGALTDQMRGLLATVRVKARVLNQLSNEAEELRLQIYRGSRVLP